MENTHSLRYIRFIQSRPQRLPQQGYECHHILPRCVGGSDELSNLIILTHREHYIAHLILFHMYKGTQFSSKLSYAFLLMSRDTRTSRAADLVRGKLHHSEETKQKMRVSHLGKKSTKRYRHSEATKEKISRALLGVTKKKDVFKNRVLSEFRRCRCIETSQIFENTYEASRSCNRSVSAVSMCLRGLQKTAGGYHWEYL